MSAVMAQVEHPAIRRWRTRFTEDGPAALADALAGRVSLGPFDQARSADALAQILTEIDYGRADESMQAWFVGLLGLPTPKGLTARRFAEALVEGIRLIALLRFPKVGEWCLEHHGELRAWLRGFYFGRSCDPEATLFVTLAQHQKDRSLLNLWKSIVRRGRPIHHVRHALTGLRLMPADDSGTVERGVPKALIRGLMDFGEAVALLGDGSKRAEWLQELDYLAAVYPMSKEQWGRRFREAVQVREPIAPVKNWLEQRYPAALRVADNRVHHAALSPPHVDELKTLLQKARDNFDGVKPSLDKFFRAHREYCRETGDTYYLVRSICFAGDRLLGQDPEWVRELAHEAAMWEPSNHYTWSLLGRALEHEGDWRRAEAVYWHARRRFPENPFAHNQLAHALLTHGNAAIGEAVYREAIRLFPDDPVCWNDLGHTLRVLSRPEEAVTVLREGRERFPSNPALANALADTLIDMNRLDDAKVAVGWAERIVATDDLRNQQILARIRRRLEGGLAGLPIELGKIQPRPEIVGGSFAALSDITGANFSHAPRLGLATLLRRKANGELTRARELVDSLPDGPEKLVELGLWRAADQGWTVAARWFDEVWQSYEGDGVLRVHRLRARSRSGESVDWSVERNQYPDLIAVILTEEQGRPPRLRLPDDGETHSQEQHQDAWFASLVARNDLNLVDRAEEDYLGARHQL